jgi:uncharacterized protein (DUF1919 family)
MEELLKLTAILIVILSAVCIGAAIYQDLPAINFNPDISIRIVTNKDF